MKRRWTKESRAISSLLTTETIVQDVTVPPRQSFASGRGFVPAHMASTPVILVPVFGVPTPHVTQVLKTLYTAQTISMGFRPIIFSDADILADARPYGWIVEHHMSEYDHSRLESDAIWDHSVLRRARLIAGFFGVQKVVVPDWSNGYRTFLRHLKELTSVEVGPPRREESAETLLVSGWRSWVGEGPRDGHTFNVETYSAGLISAEIQDGLGENTVVIDRDEAPKSFEEFVLQAGERDWPVARIGGLHLLDDAELPLALESLLSLGEPQGTMVVIASSELATRIQDCFSHERLVVCEYGREGEAAATLSATDIEMATTIRRASSALSSSGLATR